MEELDQTPWLMRFSDVPNRKAKAKINGRFVVVQMENRPYEIELSRIKSKSHLIQWIHHLSGKTVIDLPTIRDFIQAVCRYKKWSIYEKKGFPS